MLFWKINQRVTKLFSELKIRQSWHQMTSLIILQAQITDFFDESVPESRNSKRTPEIQTHNFRGITTAAKQTNTLRKEIAPLKEFIPEQLYVVEKSIDDLKNKQQTPKNLPLF